MSWYKDDDADVPVCDKPFRLRKPHFTWIDNWRVELPNLLSEFRVVRGILNGQMRRVIVSNVQFLYDIQRMDYSEPHFKPFQIVRAISKAVDVLLGSEKEDWSVLLLL